MEPIIYLGKLPVAESVVNLFKFDADRSLELTIKAGVLNNYSHLTKNHHKIGGHASFSGSIARDLELRKSIAQALKTLEHIGLPDFAVKSAIKKGNCKQATKISNLRCFGGRRNTKNAIKITGVGPTNEDFKITVQAISAGGDVIEQLIKHGIYRMFVAAEDVFGPFVVQYHNHAALFGQLSALYTEAQAEDLDVTKGCYSHGIAHEVGLSMAQQRMEESTDTDDQEGVDDADAGEDAFGWEV